MASIHSGLTTNPPTNARLSHPDLVRQLLLGKQPTRIRLDDLHHIGVRHCCQDMLLAPRRTISSTLFSVRDVAGMGVQVKVCEQDTAGIIAPVTNTKVIRDRAICHHPANSRGQLNFPVKSNLPSIPRRCTYPLQTSCERIVPSLDIKSTGKRAVAPLPDASGEGLLTEFTLDNLSHTPIAARSVP